MSSLIFWSSSFLSWQFKMKISCVMKCFCASNQQNWIGTLKLNFIVPALTANSCFNISEMISGETIWAALSSCQVMWSCCFLQPLLIRVFITHWVDKILKIYLSQRWDRQKMCFLLQAGKLPSCLRLYPHKGLVCFGSEHDRDFCLLLEYNNLLIKES